MSQEIFPPTLTSSQGIQQPWGKLVPFLSTLNSIVLEKRSLKIGKGELCDIVIDKSSIHSNDTNISREHCIILKDPADGLIYINDLSKNGTFINGTKIGKNNRSVLRDGDKIAISKVTNVLYVFQSISMEELPDTLTSQSSLESLTLPRINIPIWGRLISCLVYLDSFDLYKPVFKVGRSSLCDAVIDTMEIDPVTKNRFSKEHFIVFKDLDTGITFICDLSKGGTYLNGRLIGKNRKNILQHDDTISIGPTRKRVYVYKSMTPSDASYLPPRLRNKYEVSHILGRGGCGEVRLAYEKCTCKMYAIKKILKGRSTMSQMHKLNHPSKIHTEIKILQSLSNPFVIHLKEIVDMEDEVFLVLEYMEGGELNNRILSNETLTESNVKFLFYQIVRAVQFLHSHGIAHRDLKPENILLSSHDTETLVKVSDFGLSKITEEDDMMRTKCGTWNYIAPEVLDIRIPEYDKQVDVWSLGVLLFYMLSKEQPFSSSDKAVLGKLILRGIYNMDGLAWNGVSYYAKDLVNKMLKVKPEERITVSEILNHPWLSKDVAMQYRVNLLLEKEDSSDTNEETDDSFEVTPPSKRVRLSSSDESL